MDSVRHTASIGAKGDSTKQDPQGTRATDAEIPVAIPLPDRDRATLVLVTGLNAGELFSLTEETLIGRESACHIRLEDMGISRRHARIVRNALGRYVLQDLDSTNGTFLGKEPVREKELVTGDHIQLGPSVMLRFALLDEQEERLARQLYESSNRDPLTQIFNRPYFMKRLQNEVAYALRHQSALGLVLFDLDHFKEVNDTYGHLAGDEVLRRITLTVARLIRTEDVFARYGGEEFILLARGVAHIHVIQFSERVRRAIAEQRIQWGEHRIVQTVSLGVASLEQVAERTGQALLKMADDRLYRAKNGGRNRTCGHS